MGKEFANQLFLLPDRAIFVGPVMENDLHQHHAIQLVVSRKQFCVSLEGETRLESAILIGPNVSHAIQGDSKDQILILIDYESNLSEYLRAKLLQKSDYASLSLADFAAASLNCANALRETNRIFKLFDQSIKPLHEASKLDKRIAEACKFIAHKEDFKTSLSEIAQYVELSESRMTHLFKEQIGIPIRRFVMWLRVRRAIKEAILSHCSLTEAAHAAGFSDQAHFTRTFRDMFGFSPRQILARKGSVELHFCLEV